MHRAAAGLMLVLAAAAPAGAQGLFGNLDLRPVRMPAPVGRMDTNLIPESSGLVRSPKNPGIFWTLSDSGARPEIVPLAMNGRVPQGWSPVTIAGARNRDWESIATDKRGNLVIADVGSNAGQRRERQLYFVREPRPGETSVKPFRTLNVHFEDHTPGSQNHDCEAVFFAGGHLYFLTKHRADKLTRLYRLEAESTRRSNPLRFVDSFDIRGMVTGADTSPDGKRVAVLTYTALWLFDFKDGSIFRGAVWWTPIMALQCEAVAFIDNESVLIGNEQGWLYRIPLDTLDKVRE